MLVLLCLSLVASALAWSETPQDSGAILPAVQQNAARCISKCMMYPAPLKRECMMECSTGGSSAFNKDFAMPAVKEARAATQEECVKNCISRFGLLSVNGPYCVRGCAFSRMLKDETDAEEFSEVPAVKEARTTTQQRCGDDCFSQFGLLSPELYPFCILNCVSKTRVLKEETDAEELSEGPTVNGAYPTGRFFGNLFVTSSSCFKKCLSASTNPNFNAASNACILKCK